jgi:CRP-like cAMP-binding protein
MAVATMSQHPFQKFAVHCDPGQRIFSEGDHGATMYIVQAGRVRLFREIDGAEQTIGELEKGDFFGEQAILEGLPRPVSAEAVEQTELIEINSTIFDKMIRGNIEIAVRMLRKLAIRLREAQRNLSELQADGARRSKAKQRAIGDTSARPAAPRASEGGRLESADGRLAYALAAGETLIGRYDPVTEMRPDIDLTDLDVRRSVSRRHARIMRSDGGYNVVEEVGALHGTSVNGTALVPGQGHALQDGDRVEIGSVSMIFRR